MVCAGRLQSVLQSPRLPTLPAAAMEVLRLAAEPQLDLNAMARNRPSVTRR